MPKVGKTTRYSKATYGRPFYSIADGARVRMKTQYKTVTIVTKTRKRVRYNG